MKHYDYIIAGAGCAGLSLATRMAQEKRLAGKTILLIDRERTRVNDRTWCFWERSPGFFEPVVSAKWDHLRFYGLHYEALFHIAPYQYKMIRGIDFYDHCLNLLNGIIDILYSTIEDISNDGQGAIVHTTVGCFHAGYVFSSILTRPISALGEHNLLQHFRGWTIEAAVPVFEPGEATFMDFRTGQQFGTAFLYIMPFSSTRALVEYTVFSPFVLPSQTYEKSLRDYISQVLNLTHYKVVEEENGVIPMTSYRFPRQNGHILFIGTAGGRTRASTGYTFQFIQKQSEQIVHALASTGKPFVKPRMGEGRFHFYDSVLLNVLCNKKLEGASIFTALLQKNKMQHVLAFLDGETSLASELRIITVLPTGIFLKAAWKQLI